MRSVASEAAPAVKRVAVVGAGRIGRLHASNLGTLGQFEIVSVADPTAAAETLAASVDAEALSDWRELCSGSDIDAVAIGSPTWLHAE